MPDTLDINRLVQQALKTVDRCRLDQPGRYRRYVDVPRAGRDDSLNPYGVADAANILYTLGAFPQDQSTRDGFVHTLRSMQNPETGLWHESTHHDYHCTAHCIAAMELFDAAPTHPLSGLDPYRTPDGIRSLLESLDWVTSPWNRSHRGAGVFASLLICDQADEALRDAYFDWLTDNWDTETGMLRRGCLPGQAEGSKPLHEHMAGTFHYLFNIEADRRPLPHAKAMVDTCLTMFDDGRAMTFAHAGGFIFIDWVFCLSRSVRHSGHRFDESRAALQATAIAHFDRLEQIDHQTDADWNDLHNLFGRVCAWSELQLALPGLIRSRRPLKNVLDRRPFI